VFLQNDFIYLQAHMTLWPRRRKLISSLLSELLISYSSVILLDVYCIHKLKSQACSGQQVYKQQTFAYNNADNDSGSQLIHYCVTEKFHYWQRSTHFEPSTSSCSGSSAIESEKQRPSSSWWL
jgi:hypothetical protein